MARPFPPNSRGLHSALHAASHRRHTVPHNHLSGNTLAGPVLFDGDDQPSTQLGNTT